MQMNWQITPLGQRYRFKKHARDQMELRKIGRLDVEKVLDYYGVSHPDKKGNLCLTGYLDDGRLMRVVASREEDGLAIITVIILR